jgi:hypothetical protein
MLRFITGLVFCGPDCRAEANKSYHPYECGITDVIHHAQIGGWALAYRAVTSNDLEYFLNNRDTFMGQNEQLGSTNHDNEVPKLLSESTECTRRT